MATVNKSQFKKPLIEQWGKTRMPEMRSRGLPAGTAFVMPDSMHTAFTLASSSVSERLRWHAQLDPVPIWILHKGLQCTVGSSFAWQSACRHKFKMGFPLIQVVYNQREMATTMMRLHRRVAISD